MTLQIQELCFGYGQKPLWSHWTQDFPDACVCEGRNGAGKTTFLKIIAGVLPVESGRILVNGATQYRSSILLGNRFLVDDWTVEKHIRWVKSEFREEAGNIGKTVDGFDLRGLEQYRVGTLSEGERQWVALALSLSVPADIYLLDEPFMHLDGEHKSRFWEILHDLPSILPNLVITAHPGENGEFNGNLTVVPIPEI